MSEEYRLEQAEQAVTQERDAQIADIQNRLKPSGRYSCFFCHGIIEVERKAAMPSAKTCITCMQQLEEL